MLASQKRAGKACGSKGEAAICRENEIEARHSFRQGEIGFLQGDPLLLKEGEFLLSLPSEQPFFLFLRGNREKTAQMIEGGKEKAVAGVASLDDRERRGGDGDLFPVLPVCAPKGRKGKSASLGKRKQHFVQEPLVVDVFPGTDSRFAVRISGGRKKSSIRKSRQGSACFASDSLSHRARVDFPAPQRPSMAKRKGFLSFRKDGEAEYASNASCRTESSSSFVWSRFKAGSPPSVAFFHGKNHREAPHAPAPPAAGEGERAVK